jgi:DNA-binding CsgD family transcriptional regulator
MAMFNATDLSKLHQFLPEMTHSQSDCVLFYSLGATVDEIAHTRRVSVKTVRQQLDGARERFGGISLSSLRAIVLLRVISSLVN